MAIKILSILMILIGAILLILSIFPAKKIWGNVSGGLRRKWLIILYLMGFFIFGYLFFDIILISNLPFPVELVTGGVFLGGAFFVYLIIHISQSTIAARQQAEEAIVLAEEDWKSTFDAVTDMITVHDINFNIVGANPSAKSFFGLQLQEGIPFVKCFRCYHGTEKPPPGCVSCQSLQTGEPSMIEMFEPYLKRHLEIRAMPRFAKDHQLVGLIHVVRDITERKRAEEALKASEEKHRILFESSRDAIMTLAPPSWRFTAGNPATVEMFAAGDEAAFVALEPWELSPEFQPDGRLSSEKAVEMIQAAMVNESHLFEWTHRRLKGESFPATVLLTRMEIRGQALLQATVRDITRQKRADEELRQTLGRLRKAIGATIQVLVSAIETRDPYTAGHQLRSADLARAIATEMGLSQDTIEAIRMAGPIHDIGKLSIPAEILSKPTKLTNIEFSLIKEHARTGYGMLKDVESPWPLAEIIYQHHERMDGSGYPRNLKGDDILIEARILAVADVVESMASHRPYRPALGLNTALEEIENNKGTLYDADAVDACLRLFREKGFQLAVA